MVNVKEAFFLKFLQMWHADHNLLLTSAQEAILEYLATYLHISSLNVW